MKIKKRPLETETIYRIEENEHSMYSFGFTNRYVETMGFRTYFPERSLEAVGKSVRLGRNMAFDLFPRTDKGKIGVFSSKNTL